MSGSHGPDPPPAYEIDWTATALRGLDRLPEKAATAVVEFVYGRLASNPRQLGHALHLELVGTQSARRGPYRGIYRVDEEAGVVTVLAVAHRRDVYRPR